MQDLPWLQAQIAIEVEDFVRVSCYGAPEDAEASADFLHLPSFRSQAQYLAVSKQELISYTVLREGNVSRQY